MASVDVTSKDRERFARARELGQARLRDSSAVIGARYDAAQQAVVLQFRGGASMTIPRHTLPDLDRLPESSLAAIVVSPAGDALSWPALGIDVYVPGLVERAFGSRLFAAATGQRGGRMKSKAKATAAKANGSKGGRPPKRLAA
jgi:hypothetical protein